MKKNLSDSYLGLWSHRGDFLQFPVISILKLGFQKSHQKLKKPLKSEASIR